MSILTHRMKTARMDTVGENCLWWFPMNQAASPLTDLVAGLSVADASATFTTPHAPICTALNTSGGSGNLAIIPAGKVIVTVTSVIVNTSQAFWSSLVGHTANAVPKIGWATGAWALRDDGGRTGSGPNTTTATAGQTLFAAQVINTNTGDCSTYESINGAAFSLKGTTAGTAIRGPFTLSKGAVSFSGNGGFPMECYGMAGWAFSAVPSDLLTELDKLRANWVKGHKVLPEAWVSLA